MFRSHLWLKTDIYHTQNAMSPPRFSVRHGAVVIHVASEDDLAVVLRLLQPASPASFGSQVGRLAELSAALMDAASRARPGARLRSLRDCACVFKKELDKQDIQFLTELNSAYSFSRHLGFDEAWRKARRVMAKLGNYGGTVVGPCGDGPGGTAPHHDDNLATDSSASAALERGLAAWRT